MSNLSLLVCYFTFILPTQVLRILPPSDIVDPLSLHKMALLVSAAFLQATRLSRATKRRWARRGLNGVISCSFPWTALRCLSTSFLVVLVKLQDMQV